MSKTLTTKNVKIKRDRNCFLCERKFKAGTKMNYWAGVIDGDFNSVYSCLTCIEIIRMDYDTEFPEGYVSDMLNKEETPEQLLERFKTLNT